MTAMARAFERTGIHARDVEIDIAISKLLNSGCTIPEIRARVDVAEKLLGQGHNSIALVGANVRVPSSEQTDSGQAISEDLQRRASPGTSFEADAGQDSHARESLSNRAASASPHRDGAGPQSCAADGQFRVARPVREPSVSQRAASLNVAKISIMDTLKIDGRPYRTWGLAEAERAGRSKTRDGYILQASVRYARQRYANLRGDEKLGDLISEKQLHRFHQKAAEISDAA